MVEANIKVFEIVVFISYLASIVIVIFTITRQFKKDREKQNDKFATKESVNEKFSTMDKRVDVLEDIVSINRKENINAHKEIKDEIIHHFDKRFDDFKDYLNALTKNKSS